MTAPVVASRTSTAVTPTTNLHPISLGSPSAGDLLVVLSAFDGSSSLVAAIDESYSGKLWWGARAGGSSPSYVAIKIAQGGGSDQLRYITQSNQRSISYALRVTGHGGAVAIASSSGTGTSADPAGVSISGSAQDVLFIAMVGTNDRQTITVGPSGYTNFNATNVGTLGSGSTIAIAELAATSVTSDDPSAFTIASNPYSTFTLAIPQNAISTNARSTQVAVEALSAFVNHAVLTQMALETLSPMVNYASITQIPIEVLSGDPWPSLSNPNKYRQIQIAC